MKLLLGDCLEKLKELDEETYNSLQNSIKEKYQPSKRIKFADNVSLGLFYIGFVIFITLFQNGAAVSYSTERQYNKS